MHKSIQISMSALLVLGSMAVVAQPMPNTIIVDDKAVVPVLKTQIIRRVEGQQPVRTVEATIFEVSNKGQDIIAREVVLQDNEKEFSDKKMSIPVVQQGGVIVPTSKIEVKTTVKQDHDVIAESKHIDAAGVEFRRGEAPVQRQLKLEQIRNPEANEKVTHAVVHENGVQIKDVVVFSEDQ
ncbi:hypothetical protein [Acinetobacter shaoyimingii]|uniref:DUF2382 domain-containing protein n=1 Tax=Acinetobacter shaoyimingii TaxID=2715164 RepID=A0A6G8RYS6_9GAMM|nr:hypothetical protein [Acinetobacter shaoyimingii]QIO07089.1 hypothetical protein G8E00_14665 [Acinetobacter shaoyimingii]